MKQNGSKQIIHIAFRILVPSYDFVWNIIKYPNLIYKKSFIAEIFYRYIPITMFYSWVFSLIPVVGELIYILILVAAGFFLYSNSKRETKFNNALLYFLILNWGFLGIRSFVGHTFLADSVAESIGWQTGSFFQIELAFYHLGLAVATFSYVWNRSRDLLLGLILAKSIFLFAAMGIHIYDLIVSQNTKEGNIGFWIIFADLIVPSLIIYLYLKSQKKGRGKPVEKDKGVK